jgi:hypothetical protein
MDWDSTLESAPLEDFDFEELWEFVDRHISGDSNVIDLAATPSDNYNPMMNPFAPTNDMGGNVGEPISHSNLDYQDTHNARPPASYISGDSLFDSDFEAANLSFNAIAESQGTREIETPASTLTSSTVALSPSNSSFSMSSFYSSQCQLPDMPPTNTCQPGHFALPMQQAPINHHQVIPTQYPQTIQHRRRRLRKHPETLK